MCQNKNDMLRSIYSGILRMLCVILVHGLYAIISPQQLVDPQSHIRASITDQSELSKNVNFAEKAEVMKSPEQLSTGLC